MYLSYKYRLYPNKAQARQLDFLLWQARNVYNAALEQRINTYKETGKGVSFPEQDKHFRAIRNANPHTLGQLSADSMSQMLRRLDKAYSAFFRRIKAGETAGHPRFKGRNRFHSLEFRPRDGADIRLKDRVMLYVMNVGEIKVKYHRALPTPPEATLKRITIKRRANRWYVILTLDYPLPDVPQHTGPAVGVDMGLKSLLALSDGQTVENPRWLRQSLAQLRIAQRRLARRKKGSARRRKAAAQVARLHERVANQRRDFWHKVTRHLTDTYSLIAIEDLTLDFMIANHRLALSASDAGLGEFKHMLAYKAAEAGAQVVTVNPAYTTQMCSECGVIVPKDLSVRVHACPDCGYTADRDVNAARNILMLAVNGLDGAIRA